MNNTGTSRFSLHNEFSKNSNRDYLNDYGRDEKEEKDIFYFFDTMTILKTTTTTIKSL